MKEETFKLVYIGLVLIIFTLVWPIIQYSIWWRFDILVILSLIVGLIILILRRTSRI